MGSAPTQPYINDADFTLYVGDVREVLRELPAESVHCVVTSPPYWGLRDYSTEGQLGLEPTPAPYVDAMVDVFREVRRVLRADGTLWLNLGDSYAAGNSVPPGATSTLGLGRGEGTMASVRARQNAKHATPTQRTPPDGLKPKDLVGIPWRVAFALQADGWYLRSDIIWSKPNPMPESVTDRPTKAHEYVFLLTKSPRYFFDQEAVREETNDLDTKPRQFRNGDASVTLRQDEGNWYQPRAGRNIRSVWEIATQPYAAAHFATFPEALPERCIKAGCPEWVCGTCGKARERVVERERQYDHVTTQPSHEASPYKTQDEGGIRNGVYVVSPTVGWSDCGHDNYQPGVVMDPFLGSGTTAFVARKLGRRSIGIELNPVYAELCARRLQQQSLFAGDVA